MLKNAQATVLSSANNRAASILVLYTYVSIPAFFDGLGIGHVCYTSTNSDVCAL